MDEHSERAVTYRNKAEELRGMIPDFKDKNIRETLELIAGDYDRLATIQENLAKMRDLGGGKT